MNITGEMLIGQSAVRGTEGTLRAINPATNAKIGPDFGAGGASEVARACILAQQAFDTYRETTPEQRAQFLEEIANGILALGPALIERATQESGLPTARLEGERGRTVGQLRLFASVVRSGQYLSATLDSALPERTPPRADLRLRKIAIGPVAVFGASNFPLAFSVAGGDTAAALAAGCPVVVKTHNAHPGTSELVGRVIQQAVAACKLPEGVFSLIIGTGNEVGQALVSHPAIKAVGFTGSRQGGLALMRAAAQRREPIPVYAEMSSINPMFLLPHALAARATQIGSAFIDSLTMGVGQFCTNPGLVIGLAGEHLVQFQEAAQKALQAKAAGTMLTPGIHSAYVDGVERMGKIAGVDTLAHGLAASAPCAAQAVLFSTDAATFLATEQLEDEIFGPSSLIVACRNEDEMRAVAEHLAGQLTATLQLDSDDHALARKLLPTLERKAGRILVNGYPTGVEVSHAMVHGGPFPATSDSRSTSVGASAIDRFVRPVCYQDIPTGLLPTALQDDNPLNLARTVNGELLLG
ncbi:aldehyde dehydrogenase family protein [Collimonas arenae]|uniref:Aldehyde dehydrogenase family protein n=1 Tax=Collimonas arenae TaxID=279058 RepID=A0A127QM62_9BURK|nr:aldehyde dehydrogenase (NADP(+)) [Collimonas arenae]AMP01254.1 aldehyde dehydrogenase family protein [Collimonas arenae]AMP11151.1 aldehyde dehydrogenase family protein [Collimonas arenae]